MRRILWLLPLLVLVPFARSADNEPPRGFTSLLNGKDLEGWKVMGGKKDVWGFEKGALHVSGGGGGWLLTEKEYDDFELMFECKMPRKGNSGVALRTPDSGDPAYVGMEIQLLDDETWMKEEKLRPEQFTGAIYDVVAPSKNVSKPHGEWNSMKITCKGPKVTVELNGEKVVDANLDDYKEKHGKKHPGLLRTKGHVGFQSYNFRVEYKNIFIKPL